MDFTTFPRFSHLPPEVQMRIWEAAVRPNGHRFSGIHSFSILTIKAGDRVTERYAALPIIDRKAPGMAKHVYGDHAIAIVPERDDQGKQNRSAYFWDAGLWSACWDSRKTMIRCSNMEYWKQKRAFVQRQYAEYPKRQGSSSLLTMSREEYFQLIVDFKVPQLRNSRGDNLRLTVRPCQDAFKLSIEPGLYSLSWMHILNQLPFCAREKGGGPIRNVVLEFDSSWHMNWPAHIYCLDMEKKPRAMVSQIIWALVDRRTDCLIWLIDRGDYGRRERQQHPRIPTQPTVFYDCDEEFVEIVKEYRRHDYESAVCFIHRLGKLGGWRWDSQDTQFSIHNHIRVLKPKNLVKTI